jgi:hypothetical protein
MKLLGMMVKFGFFYFKNDKLLSTQKIQPILQRILRTLLTLSWGFFFFFAFIVFIEVEIKISICQEIRL